MDEQVIQDLYDRAVSLGYPKSKEEFISLLQSDSDVQNDNYEYVKNQGYPKSMNDFLGLVGVGGQKKNNGQQDLENGSGQTQQSGGLQPSQGKSVMDQAYEIISRPKKTTLSQVEEVEAGTAAPAEFGLQGVRKIKGPSIEAVAESTAPQMPGFVQKAQQEVQKKQKPKDNVFEYKPTQLEAEQIAVNQEARDVRAAEEKATEDFTYNYMNETMYKIYEDSDLPGIESSLLNLESDFKKGMFAGKEDEYQALKKDLASKKEDIYSRLEKTYLYLLANEDPKTYKEYSERRDGILEDLKKAGYSSWDDYQYKRDLQGAKGEIFSDDSFDVVDKADQIFLRKFRMDVINQITPPDKNNEGMYIPGLGKGYADQGKVRSFHQSVQPILTDFEALMAENTAFENDYAAGKYTEAQAQAKYKELKSKENDLSGRLDQAKKDAEITDFDIKRYEVAARKQEALAATFNEGFKDLKRAEDYIRTEQENRQRWVAQNPVLGTLTYFVPTVWEALSDQTAISLAKSVKPLAETVGLGEGYGWTDALYYGVKDAQENRQALYGYTGQDINGDGETDDLPGFAKYGNILGQGVGSVIAFMMPASAASKLFVGTSKAMIAGRFATNWASGILMMEGTAYDEAIAAGLTGTDAAQSATLIATLQSAAEAIVPDIGYLESSVQRAGLLSMLKAGKITKKQAFENGMKYIGELALTSSKSAVKEGGEEVVGQFATDIGKSISNDAFVIGAHSDINNPLNPEYSTKPYDKLWEMKNYTDAAIGGALTGGFVKMLAGAKRVYTKNEMEALSYMGQNWKSILTNIQQTASNRTGKNAENFDDIEKDLKGIGALYESLKSMPGFKELTKANQDMVLSLVFRKKSLQNNVKNLGVELPSVRETLAGIDETIDAYMTGKLDYGADKPVSYIDDNLAAMGIAIISVNPDGTYDIEPKDIKGVDPAESIKKAEAYIQKNLKDPAFAGAFLHPKTNKDAVQEQTTSEVPVQSETGVSKEVERGTPTTEPQVTTEEVKKEEIKNYSIEEGIPEEDLIHVDDIFKNTHQKRIGNLEDRKKIVKENADNLKEESVSIDNIIPTQVAVEKDNIVDLKDKDSKLPILLKDGDNYYVIDGHHRIAAQINNGEVNIKSRVIEGKLSDLQKETPTTETKTTEAVTTPVTETVTEAPVAKDVFKIDGVEYDQDQAIEKTKEAEIKWGSKMEYSGENEQAKAFADDYNKRTNPYNEDGKLKGQYIQARIAEALNKLPFKKFAELYRKHINPTFSSRNYKLRKGTTFQQEAPYIIGNATFDSNEATDQFLAFAKEAGIEVAPTTAVEATPVAKPAPVVEAPAVEVTPAEEAPKKMTREEIRAKEEEIAEENRKSKENKGENIKTKDYKTTKKRGQDLKVGDVYVRRFGDTLVVYKVLSKLRKYTGQFYTMDVEILHVGNHVNRKEVGPDGEVKEDSRRVGNKTIDTFKNMISGSGKFNFGEVTVLENFETAPESKAETPVAETPVAEAKPTKKAEPTPAPKGKFLLTDKVRKQIADIAAKWKKVRESYIKRTGEEPLSEIEIEIHTYNADGAEDLEDQIDFTGIKNINKVIEDIRKQYPNLSRIDFKYPDKEDGSDWNWITIYEVEAPAAAEAVVEETPAVEAAPAPKAEPAPTPTPAPAKKTAAEKKLDEEMQQLMLEIDSAQDKVEQLKEEIEIEKGNTKEGIAEIKERMAEVKQKIADRKKSGLPKATIKTLVDELQNELEEIEAELEAFREDQANQIEIYKEDIAQEKADIKKAQRRLDKLTAKKEQATQPEAAPKKPGEMSMAEVEKRFPLVAKFLAIRKYNLSKITAKDSLNMLTAAYNNLMRFKTGAEELLLQIEQIEDLVETLDQGVRKVSKEEFKKQMAESGDFTEAQLKIFNALVDSLQTELMPEYISEKEAAQYKIGENFYMTFSNQIISKEPNAFIHEIGHFAFYKILSKEDRLRYYRYMIDSTYGKGKPSLASRLALSADRVVGRSAEGQETTAVFNVADNFSEYFAEQFRQWYMSERLFPKEIDTIFERVAQFFNLFIEKLKSGKYVDKNLSEYFNKISVKIEKQQKKNEKIQEALGIEETMMNELQDLEDFFGIDPEISPMSMRYDTPLQKMALMYNMTEIGFFPRNASEPHINRDFFQFGLKAKRATSGSYYLVNIKTGKMVKPLQRPKGGIPPQVSRMSVTPISIKDMPMDDVIETARENGFSDDVIKALLMKRGYAAKDIDSALTFNINFASAYTNNNPRTDSPLPRAFRTLDGGVNAGIKLFFDVRNKLIDFAKSDPKKKKTYAEIRAKAVELLEANPIFQGQEDTKQLELIAAFDKTLNITRGKAISAQIADIRKAIKERLEGVKDLKKAQLILRNFIRQSLPAVKVPRVFFNLEGMTSPAEGINYFNGLRKQIYDFARTDASGVVGKKILVKDAEKIKEFSTKLLKSTELYKKQSPAVQADMENALINSQYTKGPSHTLDIYSQKEVNRLIDIVSQTDSKNFLSQAEKVFDIITEQRAKIKNGLLKEMMTLVNKKATSKKTSSGKVRSNGLDAQGQAFYKSIKPIIVAAIKNDTEAMIKIADELSDLSAIQDALDKEAAGEDLTTLERDLLDKVYAFDTFGDILNMELEEVQDLLDGLKGVRSASIVRLNQKRADRAAQREAMMREADEQIKRDFKALYNPDGTLKDKNELDNDRAMIWQSFKELKIWSGLKQWLERYDFFTTKITDFFRKTLAHLGTISNILDKSGTFFTDNVYRLLNRMDEVNKTSYSNEMKHLDDLANSINGVTKGYRQIRRLIESAGVVKMVINGKNVIYNGDQLLRIYALSLNEVQRNKLKNMGFTEDKINEIKNKLGPESIEFADKLVDYFSNEYYESVNDVYSFVNDVNLGYVENYFPTQTLSKSKEQKDAIDQDLLNGNFNGIFDAESSPALKERTDMSSPIDLSPSFTNVIESHLQTMERYKAYAVGVKRLNDLFKIESVSTLLDQTGLKSTMKTLVNNSINPNAGINETQARFSGIMNKFSGYALAFKLAQIPKQATAIVAAYEDYQFLKNRKVPGLDAIMFAFDMAKALTFARSNFNKFYNISGNFRDRIVKGVEGDVYGLESGGRVFKPLSQKATTLGDVKRFIKSSAASPTMVGDIISVYGYMANYNRDIANGMSPEAALEKFNNYNATLQSRRTADKSALQFSKSGLVRAFSMFGSTGILQMNKVAMSYKNIMRSIGNKQVPSGKDLRALAINLGVANAAFVAASYVFALMKGDDEDKEMVERKMFEALIGLNLLYQIPLIGTATEEIVNAIKNNANKSETLKDVFGKEFVESIKGEKVMGGDVTNPYSSVFRKIKKYYDDDNTIIENFRPAAELALGMQLDPFIGLYEGATEDFDDEVMYDILGISPSYRPQNNSSLEKMNKTELKRYNPEEYERLYGPGSKDYDEEKAKKEAKAAERKARKEAMDDYYNYESGDGVKRGGSRIKSRGSRTSGSRIK